MNDNRLLFVDEDLTLLKNYKRECKDRYRVETAVGVKQAFEIIKTQPHFPVILTNLDMKEMDGIEFLIRLREFSPESVRILTTDYNGIDKAMDAVNSGYVFRFLAKPIHWDILDTVIIAGLDQYMLIKARKELFGLRQINQALNKIILGFTKLVEIRDPYTAGHQQRVAELSVAIADYMGLDDHTSFGLKMAALVHDIGKVYIPAEFLNKPDNLTCCEISVVKSHSQIGYDILKAVDFEWPISKIILQHHERINGSGYPNGIKGDEILIEARIIAVADVVDAMVSNRPYRPGFNIDEALYEIEINQGLLYDYEVVQACLKLFRENNFQFTNSTNDFYNVLF